MRNARLTQILGCTALLISSLAALPAAANDRDRCDDDRYGRNVRYERRVVDRYDRDTRCDVRDEYRVTRRYVRDRDVVFRRDLRDDWRYSADYRDRNCDRVPRTREVRVQREVVYRHVPPVVQEREVVVEKPVVVEKVVEKPVIVEKPVPVVRTVTKVVRVPAKVAGTRQTRRPAH